jgi:ABC-type uncharacterized transport system fused permease/ATPase subunit
MKDESDRLADEWSGKKLADYLNRYVKRLFVVAILSVICFIISVDFQVRTRKELQHLDNNLNSTGLFGVSRYVWATLWCIISILSILASTVIYVYCYGYVISRLRLHMLCKKKIKKEKTRKI